MQRLSKNGNCVFAPLREALPGLYPSESLWGKGDRGEGVDNVQFRQEQMQRNGHTGRPRVQTAATILPRSNAPTLQRSNASTFQRSNAPTFQRSHAPTLQRSNAPTLQRSNAYNTPLVLGIWSRSRSSMRLAASRARPKALNRASIL